MALSNRDQARIREYLLGRLRDDEQQKIEERLMLEDDLFEELEITKGELIEEYSAGELNPKERDWFERHFLASAEGKQHYTFARALDRLVPPQPAPMPQPGLLQRLRTLWQTWPWAVATATSAILLVAIALIVLQRSSQPQNFVAITLSNSAITRTTTGAPYPRIALQPDVGEVRFTLMLPEAVTPGVSYRAELDNRLKTRNLNPRAHNVNSVLVVAPASELPPGTYALRLVAIQADGTEQSIPGEYYFDVTN